MRHLAVVGPHAERLAALIRPHLGPQRALLLYTGDGELPEGLVEADVALGAPDLLAPMLHQLPHLRWVQSTWAGITPFLDAPRRDYLLSGVKGIFGRSMAEYVLAWTLAIKRSVLRQAGAKQWDATPGTSLSGLHLGIAGVYISSHTSAPTELSAISDFFLANLQRYEAGDAPLGLIDSKRGY